MNRVAVFGTGYVGLVTGACLAALGHRVICLDRDPARRAVVAAGRAPFHEPGLDALIAAGVARGDLAVAEEAAAALAQCEISIIAVGTPTVDGAINLDQVEAAGREIGRLLPGLPRRHTVVLKSTCVPGTTEGLLRRVLEEESGLAAGPGFGLAMNPEFLREGSAVTDFMEPDRIVIGSTDPESARALDALYARFTCPILHTSPGNAEMIKYAANTLLAALVSFSNEIAALCEALPGLDERTVMEGVHLDRRLSPVLDGRRLSPGLLSYLRAGPGYGGSCFPKDVTALGAFAAGLGVPVPLLEAIAATNRARPDQMLALLERVQPLAGRTVAVLGLAFKPGTDDVRESPGVKLVAGLLARGARVRAWDALARPLLPAGAAQAPGIAEALSGADAAIIATAWPELRAFDWAAAPALLARPLLLDARGVLEGVALPAGLTVLTVGRAPAP